MNTFWNNFLINFSSSVCAGITLTFIISYLIEEIRKPRIEIALMIGTSTRGIFFLEFIAINKGSKTLSKNQLKWDLYYGIQIQPEINENDKFLIYQNKSFRHFTGTNNEDIYPNSSSTICTHQIKINPKLNDINNESEWIEDNKFYYALTTPQGYKKHNIIKRILRNDSRIDDGNFIRKPIFHISKIIR